MAAFRLTMPLSRLALLAFVPVALVLVMVAFANREAQQFRVGFVGDLTGPQSELGKETLDGVDLAVHECNAAGGILGRSVRLYIRDDKGDPRSLAVALDQLADKRVKAIVGPTSPAVAELAVSEASRKGLLLLSPTVGADRQSPRDSRLASVYPSAWNVADQIAAYMSRQRLVRPALVVDTACAPPGMMSSLQRSIPFASESIVSTTQYDSSARIVVTDVLEGVLESGPDCIIVFAAPRDTAYFLQHLRRRSAMLPVIAGEASVTPTMTALAGAAAEGLVVIQTSSADTLPDRFARFRKSFRDRYGHEAGFAAVHGYDSARIILTAASREDQGDVRRSMLTTSSFEGVQGRIVFTDAGDVRRELSCAIVRDGVLQRVE